jgi:predicted molibdopterin-dependent oxidoreductase YjgC
MLSIIETDFGTPLPIQIERKVTLTIDGREVSVPAGSSVLRAASEIGIQIPKLCATELLDAFGSCRLCLVQIDGMKGYPASCTTPVADGMKVTTQNAKLADIRRGVMELYISDHPLDCLTCPANGHCELQDMAATATLVQTTFMPRPSRPTRAGQCAAAMLMLSRAPIHCSRRKTRAIRTSPSTRRSASSVHAACAPALKCRARLR